VQAVESLPAAAYRPRRAVALDSGLARWGEGAMRSAIWPLCFGGRRVPTGIFLILRRVPVPPHARYVALAVDEWLKSLSYNDLSKLDEDREFVYHGATRKTRSRRTTPTRPTGSGTIRRGAPFARLTPIETPSSRRPPSTMRVTSQPTRPSKPWFVCRLRTNPKAVCVRERERQRLE
jgi:hypothetical protein